MDIVDEWDQGHGNLGVPYTEPDVLGEDWSVIGMEAQDGSTGPPAIFTVAPVERTITRYAYICRHACLALAFAVALHVVLCCKE